MTIFVILSETKDLDVAGMKKERFFALLRMTKEGTRMTCEGLRMTKADSRVTNKRPRMT